MLPHFVRHDFDDVVEETRAAGFALDMAWFAPHFEFRFPVIGEFTAAEHARRTAQGDRAVVRARRRAGRRLHGALRRFVASSGCR